MSYNPGLRMALWNPAVQKYKLIPDSLLIQNEKPSYLSPIFGFAYDFVAEDYKVVCVHKNHEEHPCYIVGIYSVKNQSWRTIHNIIPVTSLGYLHKDPVSLNGVIHKMVHKGAKRSIISFHLADEKFIVTPVPSTCGEHLRLHALSDRLCVLAAVGKEMLIWSVEKDRKTSWNCVTRFPTLGSLIGKPNNWYTSTGGVMCIKENGNILWKKCEGPFIEYDVRKNEYTEFCMAGLSRFTTNKALYVESLVSLKIPWE